MNSEALSLAMQSYIAGNPWIFLVLIWVITLKAFSLWQSARNGEKIWFIALLIVNTMGVLEIIYLILNYRRKIKAGNIN